VTAVFAHRFVVESKSAKYLADLGPEGVKLVDLKEGDMVSVTGAQKPSEIKVTEIAKAGGTQIRIEHKKKQRPRRAARISGSKGSHRGGR